MEIVQSYCIICDDQTSDWPTIRPKYSGATRYCGNALKAKTKTRWESPMFLLRIRPLTSVCHFMNPRGKETTNARLINGDIFVAALAHRFASTHPIHFSAGTNHCKSTVIWTVTANAYTRRLCMHTGITLSGTKSDNGLIGVNTDSLIKANMFFFGFTKT